jgi:hypothetical protein
MYLLYLDDSGTIGDPKNKCCLFAGFSIFETKTHWIEQEINAIAQKHHLDPDLEFHGASMRTGRGHWRRIAKDIREQAFLDLLHIIHERKGTIRLFASVIRKNVYSGADINKDLFSQVSSRFDRLLSRIYQKTAKRERGIVIFDKSKHEAQIQQMSHDFKEYGHQWGTLKNFAEVPLFLDSKASRLIQLADIVSYSIYRKYNENDLTYFPLIEDCFDAESGITHGLHELT